MHAKHRRNTELDALHDVYVEAVNMAVAADDLELVDRLAAEYDRESASLVARIAA